MARYQTIRVILKDLECFLTPAIGNRHLQYLNNGNSNNWINIRCIGLQSNTAAIGTKVRLKAIINGQEVWQLREISGQTGVLSQNSLNAHFGLGAGGIIDTVIIQWPSGIVQVLNDVAVNSHLEIIEDNISSVQESASDASLNNFTIYPNPSAISTSIHFDLDRPALVGLQLIDNAGKICLRLPEESYTKGSHQLALPIEHLPNGIYHCRLQLDHVLSLPQKVVIQR